MELAANSQDPRFFLVVLAVMPPGLPAPRGLAAFVGGDMVGGGGGQVLDRGEDGADGLAINLNSKDAYEGVSVEDEE